MNGIRITLYLLLIMHLLPIAITQLLIIKYPFERRKNGWIIKWTCTAANILLNGLVLYEIIMYSKISLSEITEIINFTCSYQDISRLATSNVISLSLSVLIGIGIFTWVGWYYKSEQFFHFSSKCVLLFALAAIPIIFGYRYGNSGASHLAISEICRKTTVVDAEEASSLNKDDIEDGVCYISIVNNGVLTYELDPLYLSDNIDYLQSERSISEITIKPGETYVFYMLSEHSLDIKKSGGSIVYLSDKFGNIVDNVEVPALNQDQTYISTETGWQVVNLAEEEEIIIVPVPTFSQEGGFYDAAFELELTSEPGTTIYYTLDSSNPTAESTKYSGPIYVYDRSGDNNQYPAYSGEGPVDKCFVVRAVALDKDGNSSSIITKSYFVNQEKYNDRTVISLVADPDALFDDVYGIYTTGKAYDEWYLYASANAGENGEIDYSQAPKKNYEKKGIEWERESHLEVFGNSELLLDQPVGIRIQGNAVRAAVKKRFSIYARKEYGGSEYFDANLINEYSQHSLFLRPGQGGDLHPISQLLGQGRDVVTTDFITADVFLNGEFWYTTYLFEKFSEKNFAQKYGLSKDNIVIYKAWGELDWTNLQAGRNPVLSLWSFINENDLADDANYLKYSEILDIQSYIDWYCFNTYLLNLDYYETSNTIFWHTIVPENRNEGDTRWRLGLYDMDLGWRGISEEFDGKYAYEVNPFSSYEPDEFVKRWPIYLSLKKNDLFRKQFVLTFMDLANTVFSVENTTAVLEKTEIGTARYKERYREFFENRAKYVIPYMAEEFELTGTQQKVTISSNVSGTPVTINTISPELQAANGIYSWTGNYFTDYPVTVTATDPDFSHWEITANGSVQKLTDNTIEVPVSTGGVEIHAVFK